MTRRPDPHDGWTPQAQEQEQPPVFPREPAGLDETEDDPEAWRMRTVKPSHAVRDSAGTICKCGLAKSYHAARFGQREHEYEPRYPAAREPAGAEPTNPYAGITNHPTPGDNEPYAARDSAGLGEAWAAAEKAIDFPRDHPLHRYGHWRLQIVGPWDIEYNGHRPTYQAYADPYNATGVGLDRPIEGLGPTPAAALRALAARLSAPQEETTQ